MRSMGLFAGAVAGCALVLVVAAPSSAAPKGDWQPVEDTPPTVVSACGTTLTIDEAVSRQRVRVTGTADGALIEVRGFLSVSVTAADGRSAVVNASGPTTVTATSSSNLIELTGLNFIAGGTPVQAAAIEAAGLPAVSATSGPITLVETLDPVTGTPVSARVERVPPTVVDVCTLLH